MRPLMPPVQTPDNLFHDGNPLTGELGTIVDAEHLNNEQAAIRDTQSELIAILTAAAMEPESTAGQLLAALNKLYAPLNDTLGALSSLVGGANKLPYFTSANAAALTALSSIGRDIVGKATVADVLTYLGLDRFVQTKGNPNMRLILDDASWYVYDSVLKKNIALALNMGGTGATDAAGARANLELGNSATKNTGAVAGTVAAGDDSRITGALQKTGGDVTGPLRRVGSYPNILLTDSTMDDATIGKTVGIEQSKGRLTFYLRSGDGSSSSGQVLFNMPDITGSKTLITKEECDVRYQQQTRLGAESRYGANDNYIAVPAGCVMTGLDVGGGPSSETFIGYRPVQVNINGSWATINQL
ncbi:hypothetical protein E4177_13385 [Citrobacter freundii]|uniref:hypothetical protein n=1 Tax=Citrobacter freundii TaxID=546 RepID=UPI0012A8EB56|nr:hypothetical protein [Citrobacter freundii]QGJ46565.1 hypothetical protein E4177_13385 [Citrobacter freundii]QGJ50378.1 hypothetical protein E4174_05490 [Citrobacter freundii]